MRLAREAQVRLITLTNGSAATTSTLLERARLDGYVEQVVSVEAVRRWKPAPEPYRHAAAACGVPTERMALDAATRFALTTGFIGSYSTFSTLMLESARLVEEGAYGMALLNTGGSLVAGMIAVGAGILLGRLL